MQKTNLASLKRKLEPWITDMIEKKAKGGAIITPSEARRLKDYAKDRSYNMYIRRLDRIKERIRLVKELDRAVGDLREDISKADSRLDRLRSDMEGLSNRISTASDRLDNMDKWIDNLKSRVSNVEGKISNLRSRAKDLRADIEDAYKDIRKIDDKARKAIQDARESLRHIKEKYIDKWSKKCANIIKKLGDNFKEKIQEFKKLWRRRKAQINRERNKIMDVYRRINNKRIPALQNHLNNIRDHIGEVSGADPLDSSTCKSRAKASTEKGAAGEMYQAAAQLSRFITCLREFTKSFTIDLKVTKVSFPIPQPKKIPKMADSLASTAMNIYESMKETKKAFDNVQDLGNVLDNVLSDVVEVAERSRKITYLVVNAIRDLAEKLSDIVAVSVPGAPSFKAGSKKGAKPSKKGVEIPERYRKRKAPIAKGYTLYQEFAESGGLKKAKIKDPQGNVVAEISPSGTAEESTSGGTATKEEIRIKK